MAASQAGRQGAQVALLVFLVTNMRRLSLFFGCDQTGFVGALVETALGSTSCPSRNPRVVLLFSRLKVVEVVSSSDLVEGPSRHVLIPSVQKICKFSGKLRTGLFSTGSSKPPVVVLDLLRLGMSCTALLFVRRLLRLSGI